MLLWTSRSPRMPRDRRCQLLPKTQGQRLTTAPSAHTPGLAKRPTCRTGRIRTPSLCCPLARGGRLQRSWTATGGGGTSWPGVCGRPSASTRPSSCLRPPPRCPTRQYGLDSFSSSPWRRSRWRDRWTRAAACSRSSPEPQPLSPSSMPPVERWLWPMSGTPRSCWPRSAASSIGRRTTWWTRRQSAGSLSAAVTSRALPSAASRRAVCASGARSSQGSPCRVPWATASRTVSAY
mmetsp:Transcript_114808/g.335767  ORF Transcript_114808/g.335767 Transcript_114808/m.335767 type:complete len:235 (+) Transcript_114808:445-1149(+)